MEQQREGSSAVSLQLPKLCSHLLSLLSRSFRWVDGGGEEGTDRQTGEGQRVTEKINETPPKLIV